MNDYLFHMSNIMSGVESHGTESLVDKILILHKQLESINHKYDSLQQQYTAVVNQNYKSKTEVRFLRNEVELLRQMTDERERFHNARYRQSQSRYDRLKVEYDGLQSRYRVLRDKHYSENNGYGEYGFDLTGDVTEEDRKLNHQDSPYTVKQDA